MPRLPPAPSGRLLDLMLAAAVVVLYGDAIAYGYIWDDHLLSRLGLGDVLERSFTGVHVRPVWYFSHVLSSTVLRSPVFDHAVNLLLFILAAALARRVAALFLGRSTAAFLVALTWVFLPWNAFPATWVAQRNDLLIFVFGFAALLALDRRRHPAAFAWLTLAVFSKPTIAFLPVFFLWKWRVRQRRLAVAAVILLAVYWALALRGYLLYFDLAEHVAGLPVAARLIAFPVHWAEHFFTLAVPVPFFVGIAHAGVYLGAAAGLLAVGMRRPATARGEGGFRGRDVLALALLASVPKAVTPELRICGFESLFWLILIASRLRLGGKPLAAACYLALMASYGTGLLAAKAIFDTRLDEPGVHERAALYPNRYYAARREFLVGLARRWRLLPPRTSGTARGGEQKPVLRLIFAEPRDTLRPAALGTAVDVLDGAPGAAGWLPMGPAGSWRIENEELVVESGGAAFDLERPLGLSASQLQVLEVVLASGYKVGLSLSWRREGEDDWIEPGLELGYNAGRGDQYRKTFAFDLLAHGGWSGTIERLRLRFEPARQEERIVVRRLQGWRQEMSPDLLAEISRRPFKVELDREVRHALVIPPGHPVDREVRVPEDSLLDFGLGATGRLAAPVTLRVSVVRPSGTPVLYESRLEPVAYAAARRWQRVTLDLGAFGGETLRLRFESLADPGFDPALGFPACAHPEIVPSKVEATRPNVILISVDTLRADRLSLYGYGRRTSPRIDAWARRFAVVFSGAVVQAPWTLPSHTSMLTGLDALRHGVNHSFRAAPEELRTLAERFHAAGYFTAGITGGGWLHPHYGLAQGYERYRYWIGEGRGDEELETHAPTAAIWLDELREPFFLFLHTYDVHDFNAPDRATPPASGDRLADLGRGYDRAVTHMDGLLGRFLERFESRGLRGRTVLALTSDHGEDLGEDGVYGHGSLRDQVLLVPLVLELPDGLGAGKVIEEQVRSVDVVPTLLDLAGIEAPPELDGVSLRRLVAGEPAVPPAVASAYFSLRHGVALRFRNRWKYVYDFSAWETGRREALYRLPGGESPERDDVATGHPQTARFRTMARRLIDERLAGLVLGFENSLPTPFSGTLRGDLVGADVPKSTDLSGPWLTRLDKDTARFSLPPGERFHLLFERLGEPRFVLETPAADGLPRESRRLTVDLDELTLPASYRWTGTRWQSAAETALRDAGAGVTIEWRRTAGAAEGAAPFQQDPELRRQLEALGYLD